MYTDHSGALMPSIAREVLFVAPSILAADPVSALIVALTLPHFDAAHFEALEGERVEERLEGRSRLARRDHHVHLPRGVRPEVGRADPREHLAARVVEDDDRAVFDVPAGELGELGRRHRADAVTAVVED